MHIPSKYRSHVYTAAYVSVFAAIIVAGLTSAGIVTTEQIDVFFATLALIINGAASVLARLNVTPD